MGANSEISWTHHTFNVVWGCQRVSPGCQHCYAEMLAKRWGHNVWGPAKTTERRTMSDKYWEQPRKWNELAAAAGERHRVFCSSMADVFEDHPTNNRERPRLFDLINETPHLDWLLLTKRPENIMGMLIDAGRGFQDLPPHIWIGTSIESQEYADKRIPQLLKVPAHVRFLSCEPLLEPIDLSEWLVYERRLASPSHFYEETPIHWVIVGGESGPGARPMNPAWARSLRDQCQAAGVAYHFKQWGEYRYGDKRAQREDNGSITFHDDGMPMYIRVGKHAAGRQLDGREWNEFPWVNEAQQ